VAGTGGVDALVIDLDAHVLVCHSEKEQTASAFKHTIGYHPLLAFCDNTGEFLAAGQRRVQQRHRPHHRPRPGPRPDPRCSSARAPDPGSRRRRRVHQGVPRPHPQPAQQRDGLQVLGRLDHHQP